MKKQRADYREVTLVVPTDLVAEARHLALRHGISLSGLVSMILEERVSGDRYRRARRRQEDLLQEGFPLGTKGVIGWQRAHVHKR